MTTILSAALEDSVSSNPMVGLTVLVAVHVFVTADCMLLIVSALIPENWPVHLNGGGPGSLVDSHVIRTVSPFTTDTLLESSCVPTLKTGVSGGTTTQKTLIV